MIKIIIHQRQNKNNDNSLFRFFFLEFVTVLFFFCFFQLLQYHYSTFIVSEKVESQQLSPLDACFCFRFRSLVETTVFKVSFVFAQFSSLSRFKRVFFISAKRLSEARLAVYLFVIRLFFFLFSRMFSVIIRPEFEVSVDYVGYTRYNPLTVVQCDSRLTPQGIKSSAIAPLASINQPETLGIARTLVSNER